MKGIIVSWVMKVLMIAMGIYSMYKNDYLWTFASFVCFFVALIPVIIKRDLKVVVPWPLDFLITLSLFLHVAGGVINIYHIIPFYDKILHFFSTMVVATVSFIIVYLIDKYWSGFHMDLPAMAFLIVILSIAGGVFWEFGEFASDKIFGTRAQLGLDDTMWDLIYDTIGGVVAAVLGSIAIKKGIFQKGIEKMDKSIEVMMKK